MPASADSTIMRACHEVLAASQHRDLPNDPLPALEDTVAQWVAPRFDAEQYFWLVRSGEQIVGACQLELPLFDNAHLAQIAPWVNPRARRQGFGAALARQAVAAAEKQGRRVAHMTPAEGTDAAAVADRWGLVQLQLTARSLLRVSEADFALIDAELAKGRAGYRLVPWLGEIPEDLLEQYANAKRAMGDAPTGKLDLVEPSQWTPKKVREQEKTFGAMQEFRGVAAIAESSKQVVGLTEVRISHWTPARAWQEDTSVVREHRGRGLGIWLKSAMLRWLRDQRPDVQEIQTWNADENYHMRSINDRLGFRVDLIEQERQAPVSALLERLS